MKQFITKFLILFILFCCSLALAQEDALAGISICNGWISGTVTAHFDIGSENESIQLLKVDCKEPQPAYPEEILTVSEGYVSKQQMQQALKAAGQTTEGTFQNRRGKAIYSGDFSVKASANITKEEAAEQAIRIGLKYFEALGVQVDPIPSSVYRPYDYDAYMEQQTAWYEHAFSDSTSFIDHARAYWQRISKHHPKQTEYTSICFYILLDGMRLDQNPSYPAGYKDEPEAWEGFSVSANVLVSDSGILVEASCDLLEIKSRRPLDGDPVYAAFLPRFYEHTMGWNYISAKNWQEALSSALTDSRHVTVLGGNEEDKPYINKTLSEPIIAYGSKSVITSIQPVLHTISRNEWAPLWIIETKREFSDGWRN